MGQHRPKGQAAEVKLQKRLDEALAHYHQTRTSASPPSALAISKEYQVNYGTLRNRINGTHQPAHLAHEFQQCLSHVQENILVEWLHELSSQCEPISKRGISAKIRELTDGKVKPSKTWAARFLQRHPSIKLGRPSGLDPKRAQCFNRTVIEHYFELLKSVLVGLEIPWENVWNMDEKGCQRGGGRKRTGEKFFVPRNRRPCYRIKSDNLELVTVIECVNAAGAAIKPGFIFSGASVEREWMEEHDDIFIGTSPNGWTDEFLCTKWFEETFIPQSAAYNTSGKDIALIFDGHGSHLTEEIHVPVALGNQVQLICLPAHCTHRLQPLDVGIFGPLANNFSQRCDEVLQKTGEELSEKDFVKEYMVARAQSFKPETIRRAFEKSGIRPLNPGIFTDEDYAPSLLSSTSAHLPPSYPKATLGLQQYHHLEIIRDDPFLDNQNEHGDNEKETDGESTDSDGESSSDDEDESPTMNQPEDVEPESTLNQDHSGPQTSTSSLVPSKEPSLSALSAFSNSDDLQINMPLEEYEISAPNLRSEHRIRASNALPFTPAMSNAEKLAIALAEVEKLQQEKKQLANELDASTTHCAIAARQIGVYKSRLNKKNSKGSRKSTKINLGARWTTSGSGKVQFEALMAEKKEKARKKEEAQRKKQLTLAQKQANRLNKGPTQVFSGSLASKSKDDLQELTTALVIPLDPSKKYTKADYLEKIRTHLNENAEQLRQNSRFLALYLPSGRTQRRNKENIPPPQPVNQPAPSSSLAHPPLQFASFPPHAPSFMPYAPPQPAFTHSFGLPAGNHANFSHYSSAYPTHDHPPPSFFLRESQHPLTYSAPNMHQTSSTSLPTEPFANFTP